MSLIFNLGIGCEKADESATYRWLKTTNENTIKHLHKTIEPTKIKLINFLVEQKISFSNIEIIANLLIHIWITGLQALDMLKSINYDEERDKLRSDIENGKNWIRSLKRQKTLSHVGMKSILSLDLKFEIDIERELKLTQEKIDYMESILTQSFEPGNPLNYKHIKKLLIFTMFYTGQELLKLEHSQQSSPLYRLISILAEINTGTPFDVYQLYSKYSEYCKLKKDCLEKAIEGERLGVYYSFTPDKKGWKYIGRTSDKTIEHMIETDVSDKDINLLKFIYAMKIPDHILTMMIFDYDILSKIISYENN